MTDQDIYNAIVSRKLTPNMVGLRQFEVRFEGSPPRYARLRRENECDMVSQLWNDSGLVGNFMHCSDSATDQPSDFIEGIGGEYAEWFEAGGYFPTVSYLSDDPDLLRRIDDVLRRQSIERMLGDS